jgi:DNA-directed RNA polymerase subunit RPC12/RpoP
MNQNEYLCPNCHNIWKVKFQGKHYKCPKCKIKVGMNWERYTTIDEYGNEEQGRGFYIVDDEEINNAF